MSPRDAAQIKEKIISIIRRRGPSLPVHISNETELDILFASAFLSELLSDKKIKMSNIKVGNSSLYFLPGQEYMLEKFSHYLKSKEKDAFSLLREKKFLRDSEQEPAIRVALRAIKDFAIPLRKDEKIFWRYFLIPESEFILEIPEKIKLEEKKEETEYKKEILPKKEDERIIKEHVSGIFNKPAEKIIHKKIVSAKKEKGKKKTVKTPAKAQKQNEKFFNKVKEFLAGKSIEISGIEGFNKEELILKARKGGEEKIIIAYNKKRITENEIIKANKKFSEYGQRYIILSFGEPPKKIKDLIDALKNLAEIEKIE